MSSSSPPERATDSTCAPSAWSMRAVSRPMPRVAPVTMHALPCSPRSMRRVLPARPLRRAAVFAGELPAPGGGAASPAGAAARRGRGRSLARRRAIAGLPRRRRARRRGPQPFAAGAARASGTRIPRGERGARRRRLRADLRRPGARGRSPPCARACRSTAIVSSAAWNGALTARPTMPAIVLSVEHERIVVGDEQAEQEDAARERGDHDREQEPERDHAERAPPASADERVGAAAAPPGPGRPSTSSTGSAKPTRCTARCPAARSAIAPTITPPT